jgi:outer membrane protein assembly factor BamB
MAVLSLTWLICCYSATPALALADKGSPIIQDTGVQGGLIIHAPCGDGKLTATLRVNDSYMVHGLDPDPDNVDMARKHIQSLGLYGQVSVEQWSGNKLPYIDNLVNLFVSRDLGEIPISEVMRVLVPNGVAYIKEGDSWTKTIKPRPKEIDEWTHYMHDATGNAVAHDSIVGPPKHLQWVGSPKWSRHHDHMSSVSAVVSAGGRTFYILDEGLPASILLPPKWTLTARDAFNGTVLWKKPISSWHTHLWPLKSGPAHPARRLIAVDDKVYTTLSFDGPLTALDAATGRIIKTYKDTKATEEVILSEGVLFLVTKDSPPVDNKDYKHTRFVCWEEVGKVAKERPWDEKNERSIMAVQADTGNVLWKKPYTILPITLVADQKRVLFHDAEKIVCLNRENGEPLWSSPPVKRRSPNPVAFAPTLVVYKDVVLFAGGDRKQTAFSAENGKPLWTDKHPPAGHHSPEDLLVIDGLVWSGEIAGGRHSGVFKGRDPYTGQVKKEFPPDVKTYWFHHRCYRSKATDKYLLPSRTGTEFIDIEAQHWQPHHWVRGACVYGIMPCNGLTYFPPHPCICYAESKLSGFCALAPGSKQRPPKTSKKNRLQTGPAYGKTIPALSSTQYQWPTYRHDPIRSGSTKTSVPQNLKQGWQEDLGGKLSSVVIADRKLFVASVDNHTLHALDAGSGKETWSYTTNGRIDSPPTIYKGRAIFGSADGYVYCLRASDGQLIWRFRAAPQNLKTMSYEQLESVWPVHGSVLVQNGTVYCVAGRSIFLDGGLRLLRLNPATGKLISQTVLDRQDPTTGQSVEEKIRRLNMPVALPDILSCDGKYIYMRSQQFDLQGKRTDIPTPAKEPTRQVLRQQNQGAHLFCPTGFLDDTWFHRTYWLFGNNFSSGCNWWFRAGRYVPAGRILAFDQSSIYGYGRQPKLFCWTPALQYHLFAADKKIYNQKIKQVRDLYAKMEHKHRSAIFNRSLTANSELKDISAVKFNWTKDNPPIHARAMVLADKTLFIAGPPNIIDEEKVLKSPSAKKTQAKLKKQNAAFNGQKGAWLWTMDTANGEKLNQYKLKSTPVWDGMAAAYNRLYLATTDGKVTCLEGK